MSLSSVLRIRSHNSNRVIPVLIRSIHSMPRTNVGALSTAVVRSQFSTARVVTPKIFRNNFSETHQRTFIFGKKKNEVPPGGSPFEKPAKKGFIRRHKFAIAFFVIQGGILLYLGAMAIGIGAFLMEVGDRLDSLQEWYEAVRSRRDFRIGADELENDVSAFPPPSGRVYTLQELLAPLPALEKELLSSLKFKTYEVDISFIEEFQQSYIKEFKDLEANKGDAGYEMFQLMTHANSATPDVSELPHPESLFAFEEEIDSSKESKLNEKSDKQTDAEKQAENDVWKKAFSEANPWKLKSLLMPSVLAASNYFMIGGLNIALEEAILDEAAKGDQRSKARVEVLQEFRQKRLLLHRILLTIMYKKLFDTWPKSSGKVGSDSTLSEAPKFPLEVYLPFVDQLMEVNQNLNDLPQVEQWLKVIEGYNNSQDDLMARNSLSYLFPSQQARVAMKQHDFRSAIAKWKQVVQVLDSAEEAMREKKRNQPDKVHDYPICAPGPLVKVRALIQLGHCYSSPSPHAASVRDIKAAWEALDAAKDEMNLLEKGMDYKNKRNDLLAEKARLEKAYKAVPEELEKQIEAMPYYITKSSEAGLSDDSKERIESKDLNSFALGLRKGVVRANIDHLNQRLLSLDPQQKQR